MSKSKGTVLVAMSGGVDSSVAAALLKKRGYNVIGMMMKIWQDSEAESQHGGCCSLEAWGDVRRVARQIDIPCHIVDFREQFMESVIADFVSEYRKGRTPNPCVRCNQYLKFKDLMKKADELGCDYLATGHYARIRFNHRTNRWNLWQSLSDKKDQSYALCMLDQHQLSRAKFPIGELSSKDETRKLAAEMGLPVARKADSQEFCFAEQAGDYIQLIKNIAPEVFVEGPILDTSGKEIGRHEGIALYTVGQRRRIRLNRDGQPLYVISIDSSNNAVIVGSNEELNRCEANVSSVCWGAIDNLKNPLEVQAKIRYNMHVSPATLLPTGDESRVTVKFKDPVRAISPGQTAVFYQGQSVVGGGIID
jgi:tRNA-specific 2-thiouridylase